MSNIKISGSLYPLALTQSASPNGSEIVPADSTTTGILTTLGFTFASLLGPMALNYTNKTATFTSSVAQAVNINSAGISYSALASLVVSPFAVGNAAGYFNGSVVSTGNTLSHANQVVTNTQLILQGGSAEFVSINGAAGTDAKVWSYYADSSGVYHWRVENDALTSTIDFATATRTGISSVAVAFLNGSVSVNGTGAGSSLLTVSDTGNGNGANIKIIGNGGTTPSKALRVQNGQLQIVNDAYSAVIFNLGDAGNVTIGSSSGVGLVVSGATQAATFSNTSGDTIVSTNSSGHASYNATITTTAGGYGMFVSAQVGSCYGMYVSGASATQVNYLGGGQSGQNAWIVYQPTSNSSFRFNDGAGHDVLTLQTGTGGIVASSTVATSVAAATAWQLDCTGLGTNTNEISLANNALYTLPVGSGLLYCFEISPASNMCSAVLAFGLTFVTNVQGTIFTNTSGTANKINIYYSGTNYVIQNLTGAAITTMAVSTIKLRTGN